MSAGPETVDPSTVAEMEETIARISSHKGVDGVIIMDRRGMIILCQTNLLCSLLYDARVGDPSLYTVLNKSILCSLSLLYRLCMHYQSHHTLSYYINITIPLHKQYYLLPFFLHRRDNQFNTR